MLKHTIERAMRQYRSNATKEDIIATLESWYESMDLAGIDHEVADQAFKRIILESEFMPKPSQVVKLIFGSKESLAQSAWIDLLSVHSKRRSVYRPVAFADRQIHVAIKSMGGWTKLYDAITHSQFTEQGTTWIKKEFIECYLSSRSHVEYKMLQARPHSVKYEPILIGDNGSVNLMLAGSKDNRANAIATRIANSKQ